MAGAIFGRVAHIHDIKRAAVGFALPSGQCRAIDNRHAVALGNGIGALPRCGGALCRHLRRPPGRPRHHPEPGQVPRHRAVLQRHDAVWHAGIDQRLRADDAAGAAAAIDHDKGVRRRHQLVEAIDQLRPGHADRTGDAVRVVLLVGAAVEDSEPFAALLALGQFLGGDPRRAVFVLDDLGERFARHVHAAIDGKPCRVPRLDPAFEHRDVGIAALDEPSGGAPGQAFTSITDNDLSKPARQQSRRQELQTAQRQA